MAFNNDTTSKIILFELIIAKIWMVCWIVQKNLNDLCHWTVQHLNVSPAFAPIQVKYVIRLTTTLNKLKNPQHPIINMLNIDLTMGQQDWFSAM